MSDDSLKKVGKNHVPTCPIFAEPVTFIVLYSVTLSQDFRSYAKGYCPEKQIKLSVCLTMVPLFLSWYCTPNFVSKLA